MLLALDAMGGDYAPEETCKGAAEACREHSDLEVALVGRAEAIEAQLSQLEDADRGRLHIVDAPEVIGMDETPAVAIRKKRKSSLRVAMEMVRAGEATGCISAGNTGAIVAGGVLLVGRIPGIERPALGVPVPFLSKVTLLLDVGATVRCKPVNLYHFALVGEVFMRSTMGVEQPEIALLSNGEEEFKGDEVVGEARELIQAKLDNFIGYVEGKDLPMGPADVVVCDGFTGNILLKFMEGAGHAVYELLKEEMGRRVLPRVGMVFMVPMLKELWHRFNYERYGGTLLLGVNGPVIKAHGRSKATAISSALGVGRDVVARKAVERVREELERGGNI
ncbi:MAG: phosphate acyltransferase PlsX [Synergistales bacterium]|nr:phosphate acyltransferase PlsX [Synergistales bacterium]